MATVSFTKEMRLSEKETKTLLNFLSQENKNEFKITTPEPKKASDKTIENMVRRILR